MRAGFFAEVKARERIGTELARIFPDASASAVDAHRDRQSRQVSLTTTAARRAQRPASARHCGQRGMTCDGGVMGAAGQKGGREGGRKALPALAFLTPISALWRQFPVNPIIVIRPRRAAAAAGRPDGRREKARRADRSSSEHGSSASTRKSF